MNFIKGINSKISVMEHIVYLRDCPTEDMFTPEEKKAHFGHSDLCLVFQGDYESLEISVEIVDHNCNPVWKKRIFQVCMGDPDEKAFPSLLYFLEFYDKWLRETRRPRWRPE